jgi:hypothetical protein
MNIRTFGAALCLALLAGGTALGQTSPPEGYTHWKPIGPRGPLTCVLTRACSERDLTLEKVIENLNATAAGDLPPTLLSGASVQSCVGDPTCAALFSGWRAGIIELTQASATTPPLWPAGVNAVELKVLQTPEVLGCLGDGACSLAIECLVERAK